MSFGERLRARRRSVNLTQEKLGKMVGLKKATISSLELGTSKKPSAENLLPLANALKVNPNWLITGKGEMERVDDVGVREPSQAYKAKPTPWPAHPEQINMALVADIVNRVVKATGADPELLQKEVAAEILEHYQKKGE